MVPVSTAPPLVAVGIRGIGTRADINDSNNDRCGRVDARGASVKSLVVVAGREGGIALDLIANPAAINVLLHHVSECSHVPCHRSEVRLSFSDDGAKTHSQSERLAIDNRSYNLQCEWPSLQSQRTTPEKEERGGGE